MEQREGKVVDSIEAKQVANRFQTGSSPQEAARELEKIVQGWDKRTRAVELLLTLCRLVSSDETEAVDGFGPMDLIDEMQKAGYLGRDSDADPDRYRKLIAGYWRDLVSIWEERRLGVMERFEDCGVGLIPSLDRKEGGGRGNTTRYALNFLPSDGFGAEAPQRGVSLPPGGVRYYTDEITPSNSRLVSRLAENGLLLEGWRLKFLAVALMVLVVVALIVLGILWSALVRAPSAVNAITTGITLVTIAYGGWLLLRRFVELVNNRIAVAPMWMQSSTTRYDDRLMEFRHVETADANAFYLTRYAGKCPLCGGKVVITDGRREFYGRLVGRCYKSPNEHVYSFDHVLRVGKPLR